MDEPSSEEQCGSELWVGGDAGNSESFEENLGDLSASLVDRTYPIQLNIGERRKP